MHSKSSDIDTSSRATLPWYWCKAVVVLEVVRAVRCALEVIVQAQRVRQGNFDVCQARTVSQSEKIRGSGTGGNLNCLFENGRHGSRGRCDPQMIFHHFHACYDTRSGGDHSVIHSQSVCACNRKSHILVLRRIAAVRTSAYWPAVVRRQKTQTRMSSSHLR